ncbi:MAG: YegP family protein [Candidatus Nanopelagicales bacterium]
MTTSGKFELYTDKSGEWRFRLKAVNGQTIAASQGYASKENALNGIDSVRRNAAEAELVEVGMD